jgi:hypothetical protein
MGIYAPSEKQLDTIGRNFQHHRPHGEQSNRYEEIRRKGRGYAELLVRSCPESRELSLALTKLEEVCFWANASIARNESDQSIPPTV